MHLIHQAKARQGSHCLPFPETRHLLAMSWWAEELFPWFAGILRARKYIEEIAEMLVRAERIALLRACLTALVLMDDADAAAACSKAYLEKRSAIPREWDAEFAVSLSLIDQRMGTSYLAETKLEAPRRAKRIRRAVYVGDLVRGGIPTDKRRQFQRSLAELVALSTPFDHYPAADRQLLPTRLMHHRGELADWGAEAEANHILQKATVRELYHAGGLESAKKYLSRHKPRVSAIALPFTRALEQFAGRGWDQQSVEELLTHLQPNHPAIDLETALELDIHLRVPIAVTEAIFENLIAQFPLYYELYHRFAVQLLLRSKASDSKAANLYAKGDVLRARWKTQWAGGFQVPVVELTVSPENNLPDGRQLMG